MQEKQLLELIEKCKGQLSSKRIEENVKFVFKHTMKHMKEKFKVLHLDVKSDGSYPDFYHYYFQEVVEATGISYEAFQDPLNKKKQRTIIMPKTLNNNYILLLFRSQLFLNDFKSYISSSQIIDDYTMTVPKKIEKVLLKWERIIDNSIDKKAFREKLSDYFYKNKQCKLPWTLNEIHTASNYLMGIMNSNQSSQKEIPVK